VLDRGETTQGPTEIWRVIEGVNEKEYAAMKA